MKNARTSNAIVAAVVMFVSFVLASCAQPSAPDMPGSTSHLKQITGTQSTITITNNTAEAVNDVEVYAGQTEQTFPSAPNSSFSYPIPAPATAVVVYGTNLPLNVKTAVQLPDGTKVGITWTGAIVVVDTIYMN